MGLPLGRLSFVTNPIRRWTERMKIQFFMNYHRNHRLSSDEIIQVLDLYLQWRAPFGRNSDRAPETFFNINALFFSYKVLHYILERMYWSQFNDGYYMGIFLNLLYQRFDAFYIFPPTNQCRSLLIVEPHEFLEYFLRHAYRQKLIFDGRRMLSLDSVPLRYALNDCNPDLLGLMLRYGALHSSASQTFNPYNAFFFQDFDDVFDDDLVYDFLHRIDTISLILMAIPLRLVMRINPTLMRTENLSLSNLIGENYKRILCCWNLLLSDFPQWSETCIEAAIYIKDNCRVRYLRIMPAPEFIERLASNVLPDFRKHFVLNLKHSCRLVIRRVLNDNWLLPSGIDSLPIAAKLKDYLNLISHDS